MCNFVEKFRQFKHIFENGPPHNFINCQNGTGCVFVELKIRIPTLFQSKPFQIVDISQTPGELQVEERGLTHDSAYERLVSLLAEPDTDRELHYRHFPIKNRFITIQESRNFLAHGTTGLHAWQVSLWFYNFCWIPHETSLLSFR